MRTKFLWVISTQIPHIKNTGGVKFWQIVVDEANGEEYFVGSDQMTHCIYEHWPGKFWQIVYHSPNSRLHPIFSHAR